jgi:hypothetical protein
MISTTQFEKLLKSHLNCKNSKFHYAQNDLNVTIQSFDPLNIIDKYVDILCIMHANALREYYVYNVHQQIINQQIIRSMYLEIIKLMRDEILNGILK